MRLLATVVLAVGFLLVWTGWTESGAPPEQECPTVSAPEYSYSSETRWWPPGTRECVVVAPDGEILAANTYRPWRDYVTVILLALAVAVLRLRPSRILASLALAVAGAAVWFGVV
jgi:hypothetical protein